MNTILEVVTDHLSRIYPALDYQDIALQAIQTMGLKAEQEPCPLHINKWSENDVWCITYGDTIQQEDEAPLKTLDGFAKTYLEDAISGLHILPFFPYSSDEGFSVIDYSQVNDSLGGWHHIETLAESFDLMGDLVINHCSQRSRWFENFKQRKDPGKDYFIEGNESDDLTEVVRPRTSPLLRETRTLDGDRMVWCTFSHDQVDLNFKNPDVFLEMVLILKRYIEQGIKIFRMDAVAFLWKEVGTSCVHLPETHEFVRLLRTLIEAHSSETIVITETNVPMHENLSYFGNANEAHGVYNFSLPPLLIHALVSGSCEHLKQWQMNMPQAQDGTFYFNFIASHDGIGLRPAFGLLNQQEIDSLINTMQSFGARVSWRAVTGGKNEPYEINVSLYDALQGTESGPDKWQFQRFICAHAVMLALEGIPGIYIHSLLGTRNDYERLELTQHNRNINRHKWQLESLCEELDSEQSTHRKVLNELKRLITLRRQQPAFHPNALQFTLHLQDQVFGFWRQRNDAEHEQSIYCLFNLSNEPQSVPISSINLAHERDWINLVDDTHADLNLVELTLSPYQFVWLSDRKVPN
ncbi:MAG: alpha-glucosidase C-terminal domain-containing protein [Acidiferrobacterales bacterium]|nr:alpha-glucosidase C-terminal domain-containing protein [Acidiferrobacterales bacterium]